jgi:chromosome segregation ATPase
VRKTVPPLLLLLSLAAAGCGDTPHDVVRDIITFRNELADEALRVTDEASAKATLEGRINKMKSRQESIKKRLDAVKEQRKKLEELEVAREYFEQEMQASGGYLEQAKGWLDTLSREAGGQGASSISSLQSSIDSMSKIDLPQAPPKQTGAPGK